ADKPLERPGVVLPERWPSPSGAHDPMAHIPFGSGPRLCPGRTLALLEMKLVIATLYRNFDVERHGRAGHVREAFSFTMSPAGLRVRLRARRPVEPSLAALREVTGGAG